MLACRFRAFVAESSTSDGSLSGVVEVSLQSSQVQKELARMSHRQFVNCDMTQLIGSWKRRKLRKPLEQLQEKHMHT